MQYWVKIVFFPPLNPYSKFHNYYNYNKKISITLRIFNWIKFGQLVLFLLFTNILKWSEFTLTLTMSRDRWGWGRSLVHPPKSGAIYAFELKRCTNLFQPFFFHFQQKWLLIVKFLIKSSNFPSRIDASFINWLMFKFVMFYQEHKRGSRCFSWQWKTLMYRNNVFN